MQSEITIGRLNRLTSPPFPGLLASALSAAAAAEE